MAAQQRGSTLRARAAARAGAKPQVNIFVSYSHKDSGAREKLETHLAALKRDGVTTWFDGDINAGDALDTGIARELRQAHIFVALLSPDYLASTYCWKLEFTRAMSRRSRGLVRVVAVVVRPCDWKATTAAHFKLLPTDGKPITAWRPADKAYLDISSGIRRVVGAVRLELAAKSAAQGKTPVAAKAKPTATKVGKSKAGPAKPKTVAKAKPTVRRPLRKPRVPRS